MTDGASRGSDASIVGPLGAGIAFSLAAMFV